MSRHAHITRLDLPVVLPEIADEQDACIARVVNALAARPGVVHVHVARAGEREPGAPAAAAGPQLCLHYDPARLSLARVTELAHTAGAAVTERFGHAVRAFRHIGTEDDGRRLEEGLLALRGVTAASVNVASQVARVEFDRQQIGPPAIERAFDDLIGTTGAPSAGVPEAGAETTGPEESRDVSWYGRHRELAWSLTAGALLGIGYWLERTQGLGPLPVAAFVASYVFGARDNVGHFLKDLRKGHFRFNIDLLMVVAAAGAAGLGQWAEGALLLFLFSLGHALEHYALGRARNAIKALAELAPTRATVLRDEGGTRREEVVPIAQVRPGDHVLVKPAERLSVDGTVVEGRSSVNQAPITGESVPVDKDVGAPVYAGSVNGDGALVIAVTTAIGDRTLDRVIALVADAQTQKAPTQQFTERFERVFVPLVLLTTVLLIVVPPMLGFWEWRDAFYRAMTLLVAASPCALALGTPAAVLTGIAQAARNGVLIKGGAHLETLGTIGVLALDKTGTITRGEPSLTDLVPMDGVGHDELLALSAAVERRSQHPVAKAVLAAATEARVAIPEASDVEAVTGHGIRARVGADRIAIGRLRMFEADPPPTSAASSARPPEATDPPSPPSSIPADVWREVRRLEAQGRTVLVVARTTPRGVTFLGVIGVADEPREDVQRTLQELRAVGVRQLVMLTGDNAGVARAVAERVGIDDFRAGLMPEDKVTAIRELTAHGTVAMVGDGVNDAPALANATVGIAMGGAGTAAALETADVALMGDDLGRLPFAVGLSRQARRVIRQNLFVALGVIALLMVASITGVVGIGPAVIVHEGSTLVVIANALRLLAYRGPAHVGASR